MLADPAFERALALIQIGRPSVYINGTGGHVTDATASVQSANNRLHEMRGWDLYQTALFALVREEKPRTPQPTETYPDSGSLDHEN